MRRERKISYTEEQLLDILREEAQKIAPNPLTSFIYKKCRISPTHATIINRFGSWKKALDKAGISLDKTIKPKRKKTPQRSKEEMIDFLVFAYEKIGDSFTLRSYEKFRKEADGPSASGYVYKFGSWNQALKKAGIKIKQWKDDELLQILRDKSKILAKFTTTSFGELPDVPPVHMYTNRFGSWSAALTLAGIDIVNERDSRFPSNEELLKHLKQSLDKHTNGECISRGKYEELRQKDPSLYPYSVYRDRFGGWNNTLELLGIELLYDTRRRWTKADLIDILQKLVPANGEFTATVYRKIKDKSMPAVETFIYHFGSWTKAIEAMNEFNNQNDR